MSSCFAVLIDFPHKYIHIFYFYIFIFYIYIYFCFLGLHPWHTEVPRLGVQSEL